MAKVTYRGVTYDTTAKKICTADSNTLTYRGHNYVKEVKSCSKA